MGSISTVHKLRSKGNSQNNLFRDNPGFEPLAAGWEAQKLHLCYAAAPRFWEHESHEPRGSLHAAQHLELTQFKKYFVGNSFIVLHVFFTLPCTDLNDWNSRQAKHELIY